MTLGIEMMLYDGSIGATLPSSNNSWAKIG